MANSARATIIIPIRHISESESLVPGGFHECLGVSAGTDGWQFHHEKLNPLYLFFFRGLLGVPLRQIGGNVCISQLPGRVTIYKAASSQLPVKGT